MTVSFYLCAAINIIIVLCVFAGTVIPFSSVSVSRELNLAPFALAATRDSIADLPSTELTEPSTSARILYKRCVLEVYTRENGVRVCVCHQKVRVMG